MRPETAARAPVGAVIGYWLLVNSYAIIKSRYEEEFQRQHLCGSGSWMCNLRFWNAGENTSATLANAFKQWTSDRAVDRATRGEFRERALHSIVDRRETGGGHSTEPTLWRGARSRTPHGDGTGAAEYAVAPANVDRGDDKIATGLYIYRHVGRGPADPEAVEFLHADDASQFALK